MPCMASQLSMHFKGCHKYLEMCLDARVLSVVSHPNESERLQRENAVDMISGTFMMANNRKLLSHGRYDCLI